MLWVKSATIECCGCFDDENINLLKACPACAGLYVSVFNLARVNPV
jgi:hypothetical protein